VKSETHAAQPAAVAAVNDTCNPRVATIKDEYGIRYNCRGQRLR